MIPSTVVEKPVSHCPEGFCAYWRWMSRTDIYMHSDAAHECDHDEGNYNCVSKGHGDNDYHEACFL